MTNEPSKKEEQISKHIKALNLTPFSHAIIALSTAYREYNPIFIKTFHSLLLLNGVDCIVTENEIHANQQIETRHCDLVHVLPVSKCKIVGIIVYCHYKSNRCFVLVIDDGTGHCDCTGWIDCEEQMDLYQVGDIIQVQGEIKILSLKQMKVVHIDDIRYEGWTCFRELKIHSLQKVTTMNDEILHWLSCLQFQKRIYRGMDKSIDLLNDEMDVHQQVMCTPVLNGLQVFQKLPLEEQLHMYELRGGFDDSTLLLDDQNERLFTKYYGWDCKCDLRYRDILLYCHCLATKEPLDPNLVFRDALLCKLIDMENELTNNTAAVKCFTEKNNNAANKSSQVARLEFQYLTLFHDEKINALAKEIVSETKDPGINLRRIYINTFKHLRKDGVLYLLDVSADTYLLMSKDRVLLPEIIRLVENDQSNFQHKLLPGASTSQSPPQLPDFLQRSLSSAKLKLLLKLARMKRSSSTSDT